MPRIPDVGLTLCEEDHPVLAYMRREAQVR
jgi:hypothetical protein